VACKCRCFDLEFIHSNLGFSGKTYGTKRFFEHRTQVSRSFLFALGVYKSAFCTCPDVLPLWYPHLREEHQCHVVWWLWWVPLKCWLHPQSAFSEIWVLATQSKEFPIKAEWQLESHAFLLLRTSTFSSHPGRLFMFSAFHNLVMITLCKSSFSSAQYVAVEIKNWMMKSQNMRVWLSKMVLAAQLCTVYWGW
jgi:hypothetical protein